MTTERVQYRDGYLTISPVTEADAGPYVCEASNVYGKQVSRKGSVTVTGGLYLWNYTEVRLYSIRVRNLMFDLDIL